MLFLQGGISDVGQRKILQGYEVVNFQATDP